MLDIGLRTSRNAKHFRLTPLKVFGIGQSLAIARAYPAPLELVLEPVPLRFPGTAINSLLRYSVLAVLG
jgi:hypothetical protein